MPAFVSTTYATNLSSAVNALTGNATQNLSVSDCKTLDVADATYSLTADLSTDGTCLIIGANNITIDMAGYNITGDGNSIADFGVSNTLGYNYTTVKNGYIYDFGRGVSYTGDYGNVSNITYVSKNNFLNAFLLMRLRMLNRLRELIRNVIIFTGWKTPLNGESAM